MGDKFTVRKRTWPNGRAYWIVMRGKNEALVGDNHGDSTWSCKAMAQAKCDEINAEIEERCDG